MSLPISLFEQRKGVLLRAGKHSLAGKSSQAAPFMMMVVMAVIVIRGIACPRFLIRAWKWTEQCE